MRVVIKSKLNRVSNLPFDNRLRSSLMPAVDVRTLPCQTMIVKPTAGIVVDGYVKCVKKLFAIESAYCIPTDSLRKCRCVLD
ncbi:unnamed protein product [Strongylus vulgaris]|uniref:Uncharacterized protein n=1 Tax=Strongylus vulgaris TaxID=40348 RepID=A0A3P7M240_STRVU|nr:unnamed protein product [Strongylus vulgaris]